MDIIKERGHSYVWVMHQIGAHYEHFINVARGRTPPAPEFRERLSKFLDLPPEKLFTPGALDARYRVLTTAHALARRGDFCPPRRPRPPQTNDRRRPVDRGPFARQSFGKQPFVDIIKKRGHSCVSVARQTGLHWGHLVGVGHGDTPPSPDVRERLSAFLGMPETKLFTARALAAKYRVSPQSHVLSRPEDFI
jgi:transcriptional regulator with XRE-family HTH domain